MGNYREPCQQASIESNPKLIHLPWNSLEHRHPPVYPSCPCIGTLVSMLRTWVRTCLVWGGPMLLELPFVGV